MPRRASSGVNMGMIGGIAAALIGFIIIAALLIKLIVGDLIGGDGGSSKVSGRVSTLNLATYRDRAHSLRGNSYKIDGTIEEMLKWTENGRLISFDAKDDTTSTPVPVIVPGKFSTVNLERGAQLTIVVVVDRDGTLVAQAFAN
ncbi:MAG: hypothetical protein AAF226_01545 [Verrucomicrobiota bacterium]